MEEPPFEITSEAAVATARPSLVAIFKVFLLAGAISFGGGVLAYLREYLVRSNHWISDDEFLDALEISQTLPGLNSVNMSVIVGDRMRGAAGSVAAVIGLGLPGAVIIMSLGILWERQHHNPDITAILIGVATAAVGLLLAVTFQLGHKQFARMPDLIFIMATFVAVSLFHVSLLVVLLVIGSIAVFAYRPRSHPSEAHHFVHLRERLNSTRAHWRH
ncbi:MAG: chromate transporter [Candidatus Binataceae bacterium]